MFTENKKRKKKEPRPSNPSSQSSPRVSLATGPNPSPRAGSLSPFLVGFGASADDGTGPDRTGFIHAWILRSHIHLNKLRHGTEKDRCRTPPLRYDVLFIATVPVRI